MNNITNPFPPLVCSIDDSQVSFNVERKTYNFSREARNVVFFPSLSCRGNTVPGIDEKKEPDLFKELTDIQGRENILRYSFLKKFSKRSARFSLPWRLSSTMTASCFNSDDMAELDDKAVNDACKAFKAYHDYLRNELKPGQVYYVMDSLLNFGLQARRPKPYARSVLVAKVTPGGVMIVPFSSKLVLIRPRKDILFDSSHDGPALIADAAPAVENFPYSLFRKTVVLCVSVFQNVSVEAFLSAALDVKGMVRREVVRTVFARM